MQGERGAGGADVGESGAGVTDRLTEDELGEVIWDALSRHEGRRIVPNLKKQIAYDIAKALKDKGVLDVITEQRRPD